MKRKAVNFPICYLHAEWERSNRECLNCDLWSMCATKQSNQETTKVNSLGGKVK